MSSAEQAAPVRQASNPRRGQILSAALSCFLARGYAATTIADIRKASGATTGSIYHFFPGKGALALALLEEAVSGWAAAGPAATLPDSDAETAIRASVRGLASWGLANPALFRFLDEIRTLAATDPDLAPLHALLANGQTAAQDRYEGAVATGLCRPLAWPLAHALMLGPVYDLLRLVAAGAPAPPGAADLLAEAAWSAVRISAAR